jgi:hypothetical protein
VSLRLKAQLGGDSRWWCQLNRVRHHSPCLFTKVRVAAAN